MEPKGGQQIAGPRKMELHIRVYTPPETNSSSPKMGHSNHEFFSCELLVSGKGRDPHNGVYIYIYNNPHLSG